MFASKWQCCSIVPDCANALSVLVSILLVCTLMSSQVRTNNSYLIQPGCPSASHYTDSFFSNLTWCDIDEQYEQLSNLITWEIVESESDDKTASKTYNQNILTTLYLMFQVGSSLLKFYLLFCCRFRLRVGGTSCGSRESGASPWAESSPTSWVAGTYRVTFFLFFYFFHF